jgi:DNA topoisomerase-3
VVLEKETRPPRPHNDATLLAAMKNAGREIEDDSLAEAMRQTGLGTPATRAEIIEKLIRTGYVKRERKQLRSTEKGRWCAACRVGWVPAVQERRDRREH